MRVAVCSSLIVLFACGGAAQKPAETSSSDEPSSSESKGGSSKDPEDLAPPLAPDTNPSPAPAPKPKAVAADAPPADDAAPAVFHPTPSVTGAIDGKSFTPKVARLLSPMAADGRVALSLIEGTTCDVAASDPTMTITVTWKKGYKTDLASLKRATNTSVNAVGFARANAAGKAQFSTTFKPTGTVQVVSAPTTKDATGKLKLDVTAGEYILAGDIDVLVCTSPQ
jgi:hypothetical protein